MSSDTAVVIAALGIVATCAGGLIWVIKFTMKELVKTLQQHTKVAAEQTSASVKATRATEELQRTVAHVGHLAEISAQSSQELLEYLHQDKKRPTVLQEVKEQRIEHQHLQTQRVGG